MPEDQNQRSRDEHYQQLMALKDKSRQLDVVINEGQHAEDFVKSHPFWPILEKTLESLREKLNSDAHRASRDERATISHFLGMEEAIVSVISLFSDFTVRADSAEEEKKVVEDQIKELNSILSSPEGDDSNLADIGGSL